MGQKKDQLDWRVQVNLEEYSKNLSINLLEYNNILIIPLNGCDSNVDPLLSVLDDYYPCDQLESSLIVLDAEFSKQLSQKTRLNKDALPSCIILNTDVPNSAAYKGLAESAPVSYFLKEGKVEKVWYGADPAWFQYLSQHFFIDFIERPQRIGSNSN